MTRALFPDADESNDADDAANDDILGSMTSHTGMERHLRAMRRMLDGKNFSSVEEMNDWLRRETAGKALEFIPENDKERAQMLADEAFDAATKGKAVALAKRALALDPDCADACTVLGDDAENVEEALEWYRKGVAAGERSLGEECFREERGRFWGLVHTRPYMRAMQGMADALWTSERVDEAVGVWRRMLELDPGDHLRIRYALTCTCLTLDDRENARIVLDHFDKEGDAIMAWMRLLWHIRYGSETERAGAYIDAMTKNPYVASYLFGEREMPKRLTQSYASGEEDEAEHCLAIMAPALTADDLDWLATHMIARQMPAGRRGRPRAKGKAKAQGKANGALRKLDGGKKKR